MFASSRWVQRYLRALRDHPIRTNVGSGALVMLIGDGLAQNLERRAERQRRREEEERQRCEATTKTKKTDTEVNEVSPETVTSLLGAYWSRYDVGRAAVIVSWSAVGDVPINLMLFAAVKRVLKPLGIPNHGASLPQSVIKAMVFFVPGFMIRMPLFICYITAAEHIVNNIKQDLPLTHGEQECRGTMERKLRGDLGTIMYNAARLWIPVNSLNYYFVPPEMRTLNLSLVTVGWMTYLSLMQHRDVAKDDISDQK